MPDGRRAVIVEENSAVPMDIRVWSEATALRDAGWEVSVVCPTGWDGIWTGDKKDADESPENLEGVSVYRFRLAQAQRGAVSYVREYISAFVSIARVCGRIWREAPFCTLQFCNPPDIFFPIAFSYRLKGAGIIFDHHDLFPELVLEQFSGVSGKVLHALALLLERLTIRVAHVVMSTNESYRGIAIGRDGKARADTVVVRNGPQIYQFVPVEPDPSLRAGFPFVACYAGAMGLQDGLMELAAAIRYVAESAGRRDIRFVLLGDGAARARTLATLQEWGLGDVVEMPGMIRDRALVRRYLSSADVLLSPEPLTPLNTRSTFVKIGEYMAMGKPIVAFDLSETRFTAGDAAAYVKPGDTAAFGQAIITLLDDPERRRLMGMIGRQRILDKFGWEHQEPNLFRAYEMAYAKSRRQRGRAPVAPPVPESHQSGK